MAQSAANTSAKRSYSDSDCTGASATYAAAKRPRGGTSPAVQQGRRSYVWVVRIVTREDSDEPSDDSTVIRIFSTYEKAEVAALAELREAILALSSDIKKRDLPKFGLLRRKPKENQIAFDPVFWSTKTFDEMWTVFEEAGINNGGYVDNLYDIGIERTEVDKVLESDALNNTSSSSSASSDSDDATVAALSDEDEPSTVPQV
jgi:hypothetical protein